MALRGRGIRPVAVVGRAGSDAPACPHSEGPPLFRSEKQYCCNLINTNCQQVPKNMTGQATDTRRYPWLRRPLFWVIVVFLLLVLLVALVVAVYNRAAQEKKAQMDRQHEAIESFVAPVGWEEVSAGHSSGHFSKHPCLILSLCDRYHAKHYVVSEPPTGAGLRAIAEAAGWEEIRFVADPQHPKCLQGRRGGEQLVSVASCLRQG